MNRKYVLNQSPNNKYSLYEIGMQCYSENSWQKTTS